MFNLKKFATIQICCLMLFGVIGCSRGDSSITPTSTNQSTIYWQNFANDQAGSYSVTSLLPSSITASSITLQSGNTAYTSPVVFKDDTAGVQYVVILEHSDSDDTLYLNKYVYTTSLSFDQTLATFSADSTNFEHHQIATFSSNGTPMIVVAHKNGIDIVNGTSTTETTGEQSNNIGASYRVLVDASNNIYVQSASGVYKFDTSLVQQASNTDAAATALSNRLPIVKIVDSIYVENDITIYQLNESSLSLDASKDYDVTNISDLESEMDYQTATSERDRKFYSAISAQKIGSIAQVGNELLVSVIRKLTDTDDDLWSTYDVTYATTSFYYFNTSTEVPAFIGTGSDTGSYLEEYMYNSHTGNDWYDQSNVVGHSDVTALSVKGSSVYLPMGSLADSYVQKLDITSYSNVAQLTAGESVSSVNSVYSSNAGRTVYWNNGSSDAFYMYQVPTHIISDNTVSFSVMSYDTTFDNDNASLVGAMSTTTVPSISTTFMLNDSVVTLDSDSAKISVVCAGSAVIFAIGDNGKIYTLN